jgi:hypothetical protein
VALRLAPAAPPARRDRRGTGGGQRQQWRQEQRQPPPCGTGGQRPRRHQLKGELIDLQAWPIRAMARRAIVGYIAWYNGTRLRSTLGYKTTAEFEEQDKIRKVASKEARHGQDQL